MDGECETYAKVLRKSTGVRVVCFLKYLRKLVGSSKPKVNAISLTDNDVETNIRLASRIT